MKLRVESIEEFREFMLEAKKSALFENVFAVYNKNLLNRKFNSLKISGLENLKNLSLPCLIYANHSSWWDGLTAFQISRFLRLDSYIMMEKKQLENLSLFRRLGAFSVVRENPREAFKSINYAVKILKVTPQRFVWIFPQGEILPNDLRPLKFFNGLTHIVRKMENCAALPVAFRYEFSGSFKPEIFVKIGQPEIYSNKNDFDKRILTENFTGKLTQTLDELKDDIFEKKFGNYQNII